MNRRIRDGVRSRYRNRDRNRDRHRVSPYPTKADADTGWSLSEGLLSPKYVVPVRRFISDMIGDDPEGLWFGCQDGRRVELENL